MSRDIDPPYQNEKYYAAINILYRYNQDGSLKTSYEIKKIYLILTLSLFSMYVLNINQIFNKELEDLLLSAGLNIWHLGIFFIVLGYFVFSIANKFDKHSDK